jgi:hypothetical protein
MRPLQTIAAISLAVLAAGASAAQAATLQPIGDFEEPIYVTSDPGNPNRLFVVERRGRIEQVQDGIKTLFANLEAPVGCTGGCGGERGLLSIAPAPDYDLSGRFYVDYAANSGGTLHVAEMVVHKAGEAFSLKDVLTIPHPEAANHNGGQLQFGPDDDLYISTGDGGGSNDEFHNSQDLTKPLGKILRIEPHPGESPLYAIPSNNPFVGVVGDYPPIWSYGLRNPFRFSFDQLTGDMVIGDVGQSAREEVDLAPSPAPGVVGGAGANYGWNCREGFIAGPLPADPQCSSPPAEGFIDPVFDYPHTPDPDVGGENRCAIIGGYVVRDPSLGSLYGRYIYGDLCSGEIRSLELSDPLPSDRSEALHVDDLNSFGEDSCGRIYVVSGEGEVARLVGATPALCPSLPSQPATESTTRTTPFVGIKPQRRRVERGKATLLTVWVSPCDKRKGQPVKLLRDGRPNGSKFFDRACTARFLSRIRRRTTFKAIVPENDKYSTAESRRLTIRIDHRRRR